MNKNRKIIRKEFSKKTWEGAGVHLKRAFGYDDIPHFDPFLMLDDFRSDNPEDYLAGFPWHPHRGIETVTYMLEGRVEHQDSLGNAGAILPGDLQWMTAGSGIIHQEMPKPILGRMGGFQLWVNLPASEKMMEPRYQEIAAETIPVTSPKKGIGIRVIAGTLSGVTGPVSGIVADPLFLDISADAGHDFILPAEEGHTVFIYVIEGSGRFFPDETFSSDGNCILFGDGDSIRVITEGNPLRFLMIAGRPIGEPIAWRGPIVMNTDDELKEAFIEFRNGTFLKKMHKH